MMLVFRLIAIALIFIGVIMVIISSFLVRRNNNKPVKTKNNHNFCILIPARYESCVIEDLLKSIKYQSYSINMKDVYVIVESKKDKTVSICKRYDATLVLRKNLRLQRKGYALDDAIKYIISEKKRYDAYFIFDADNVLDKDYLKNMIPIFDKGYDLACGYRNCKNGNDSVVAACSSLTFSLVNTVFNNIKSRQTRNITFSGTGFYIKGYLIESWGGYPFHSLTEDYELSSYATLNNLTTYYNTKSIFYDEQPTMFKDTINQRIRWIKGYFDVRRIYTKKIFKSMDKKGLNNGSKIDESVGIMPYIFIILGLVTWLFGCSFFTIYNFIKGYDKWVYTLVELTTCFLIIYFILMIITFIMLILEKNNLNLNTKSKIKALFYNPIFMITYVFCAIKALTTKEVTWKKVEHGKKKKS